MHCTTAHATDPLKIVGNFCDVLETFCEQKTYLPTQEIKKISNQMRNAFKQVTSYDEDGKSLIALDIDEDGNKTDYVSLNYDERKFLNKIKDTTTILNTRILSASKRDSSLLYEELTEALETVGRISQEISTDNNNSCVFKLVANQIKVIAKVITKSINFNRSLFFSS